MSIGKKRNPLLLKIYKRLYKYFRPNLIVESVYDIDYLALKENGIRHIFFDVDNTILGYNHQTVSIQCINLFNTIASYNFSNVILLSNNSNKNRINVVCQQLKLRGVSFACKPFVFTLRRIMNDAQMSANETVIIGDQIFTDILLGNCLKISSVFVEPLDQESCSLIKKMQYKLEGLSLDKLQQLSI